MKKEFFSSVLALGILANVTAQSVKSAESLTPKQQSIVIIAAFTGSGDLVKLEKAVNDGLDSGLTVNEIGEVMLQAYAYAGFPKSLNAQNVLAKVLKTRQEKGIEDVYGEKPEAVSQNNRYDIGLENVNKLTNRSEKQTRPTDTGYSATTDVFLKEHLFADVIERNNLSFQNRELATVGILSGLLTVNPQLGAHINGALNVGNTEEQLKAVVKVLSAKVGKKVGANTQSVLTQVLENRKKTPANTAATTDNKEPTKDGNPVYPPEARVSDFGVGVYNSKLAQYFSGDCYLQLLNNESLSVVNVTFEPGCINNWHIHHATSGGGQLLIAVGGRGYYQIEGQDPVEMKAGDVAFMPPNTRHWHGAAKDSWFSHISVEVPGENTSNEWLERISPAEYNKLK